MKLLKNHIYSGLFFLLILISSCKKQSQNSVDPTEENELITTIKLSFVDTGNLTDTFRFTWRQIGGPGTLIVRDTIRLTAQKTYQGFIEILDESKSPVFNVTSEIKTLQNEHRFIYSSSTSRLSLVSTDWDTNIPPIELGLKFLASTSDSGNSTGSLGILLKHYTVSSPKTAGILAGSTDIDVSFPVLIP